MLKNKYSIVSMPAVGKHYVIRTAFDSDNIGTLLNLNGLKTVASLTAITDTYEEAETVYNNLKGE